MLRLKNWHLCLVLVFNCGIAQGDTTVFSEDVGSPAGTTSFTSHTWQNSGLTFSGSGDVRATTASSGYSSASGGGNVFLTSTIGTSFQISGINTLAFVPGSLDLEFGAFKSTIASDMTELAVEYSGDGAMFTSLAIPSQPTGSGTANWRLISFANTSFPATSNLQLRWTNGSSTTAFRLDDIRLSGDISAVPEPSPLGMACIMAILGAAAKSRVKNHKKVVVG